MDNRPEERLATDAGKLQQLIIQGAREHNLKNVHLEIPRNKLVVVTGLSGSGKSSLVFDTIYAEGQRRYVESLSSYARQFLEQLQKPHVDVIEGLSPTISIEQRTAGGNPRSTVGTQTEIYDYLRLLFARVGIPHCPQCGRRISKQSAQEIVEQLLLFKEGTKLEILSPVVRGRKGEYRKILAQLQKQGFVRARVDGKVYELNEEVPLARYKAHRIEAVVDRASVSPGSKTRLTDSIETALRFGNGLVVVVQAGDPQEPHEKTYSEKYACVACGINIPEIEPRIFSFNTPYGACPACNGLGMKMEFDADLIVPDKRKSILEGALEPWKRGGKGYLLYYRALLRELSRRLGFDLATPFYQLPKEVRHAILHGCDTVIWNRPFEGLIPHLERLFSQTDSLFLKEEISKFMSQMPCPVCRGSRLKKESLAVTIQERSIWDVTRMTIQEAYVFFDTLPLSPQEKQIASQALKDVREKLSFCLNVGLGYLTLDRKSATLSGGEFQRIRLATQVGSGLVGVLYCLDEPSIGLHARDNAKLLATLQSLRDLGNTLLVVEHDEATMRAADHIIDLGPGAGKYGGEVLFNGTFEELLKSKESLTAKFLTGQMSIRTPQKRRDYRRRPCLEIKGATTHNLKGIDVKFPLGVFICVSGVSGSGKSTLIDETLYKALSRRLYRSRVKAGEFKKLTGAERIDKVIVVDQSPIGRTPRSNPATYVGVFSVIRDLFSRLPESKARGYRPGRFSFNVKGGRCEACSGDGIKKIEMHFLPDVYVKCEVCQGERFNEATLEVKYKGYSIAQVLDMSVEEALRLFENIPRIKDTLQTLYDVGLGYIQLGQSATTLSGGEAQRVKLASELCKRSTGRTLYILDEPTTGLHFADVEKLLGVLQRLVDLGNTVLVVEHNLDVIKSADYCIDLGPEGGDQGGEVVAAGSPEELVAQRRSYTGQYLKEILRK
ncbi:excinuclease ABC subunit A [Candidatus Velamenicoccus archaeovorus]|uniref:UvrABC system protein A n=1 Tax=Velamenicoccus archaeovorus TaxID=1930593 RepID=A0A410P732_VELA1|nr:excinuclease ABC subunit UvrA [Candidatus Velamenicoccus archaeovorus]QAT18026.1 excinuclease ABC subunit A [Candidatus Velamenicoccus archaeovorus]